MFYMRHVLLKLGPFNGQVLQYVSRMFELSFVGFMKEIVRNVNMYIHASGINEEENVPVRGAFFMKIA